MFDESVDVSYRSWTRTVDGIIKVGYSDGFTDGQNTSFQSSFDLGYSQGLKFGLEQGHRSATAHNEITGSQSVKRLREPSNMNCQICLDRTIISQNVVTLFNIQKQNNEIYLNI